MQRSVIEKAWFDYCENVLSEEWTVTFAESISGANGARPPKPYVSLKVISGPRRISIDDNHTFEDDQVHLVGQRGYTVSIKAYGQEYIDGLNDIETCVEDPEFWEQLKNDADISVQSTAGILDISSKLETGFEKRASLDIIFNSSNNKITNIGPIESVEVSGTMESSKTVNTNMPIITKE